MLFHDVLDVPANTPINTPFNQILRLDVGSLKKIWIFFPPGSEGSTKVRILHEERVLYPTNTEEWFSGDSVFVTFEEDYLIEKAHQLVRLEGYNGDTVNNHKVYFEFNILPVVEEEIIELGVMPAWAL